MPIVESTYRAPAWVPGCHLQTVLPAKLFPKPKVAYRRERLATPDGDFIVLDFAVGPELPADAPVLVHFHGLEGSSQSHYALSLMHEATKRGYRALVAHFRGCGGEANNLPRAYFAGDTADNGFVLKSVHEMFPEARLFAAGVSLGANQLAKTLGDRAGELEFVSAAVAVGAPMDLIASSYAINSGINVLYSDMFMETLKEKLMEKAGRFPGLVDTQAVKDCKRLFDFDSLYTAPMHGFDGAMHYWRECSCKKSLINVRVPLLMLNAKNDPFLPPSALAGIDEVSDSVWLEYPEEGGHIGFPTGSFPGSLTWLPHRILEFFAAHGGNPL